MNIIVRNNIISKLKNSASEIGYYSYTNGYNGNSPFGRTAIVSDSGQAPDARCSPWRSNNIPPNPLYLMLKD